MASIPKIIGVLSCGFLMCLGLSNAAQGGNAASAADEMKADQSDRRQGNQEVREKQLNDPMKGAQSKGGRTIRGEVLRVEGDNYFIKGADGKEVRLHTDNNTQILKTIQQGDQIEAKVTDQNHTQKLDLLDRGTDAGYGNETRRPQDSSFESGKTGSMGQ
ncbi:MAG: hypothetical protein ABIO96_13405 [Nitrospiraceae bacterium]